MKQSRLGLLLVLGAFVMSGCSKPPPLGHEKLVYHAIGSSDTLGVGAFPLSNGYTFRIQDELKDQGRNVALFQISIPAANTDIIADAVQTAADNGSNAELATVWVGANDLINGVPVESFAAELEALLSSLQDDMEAYVIVANLPLLPDLPGFAEEPIPEVTHERVRQFNTVIEEKAAERQIPVIDLTGDAIDSHLVNDFDGIHPDDDGHERMAKLFMNYIRPAL
ncbi:MAG: SGNH/GDSL hydrolase family protein [Geminicoccaceae bacterium]